MNKILNLIDRISKVTSIDLARATTRRVAVGKIFGGIIGAVVGATFLADKTYASSCTKCERWFVGSWCGCSPPNRTYCSGCKSYATCPTGYKLSFAWGYASTGCWCSSCSGASTYTICCDCTKSGNSAYKTYSSDCGCSSTLTQSGHCTTPYSLPPTVSR